MERPHQLPITSKRKRQTSKEEVNDGALEDNVVLQNMDLDVNIKDIEFLDEEKRV